MSRASDINDAAAAWLVRIEGQASPDVWEVFNTWLDADRRHQAAFIRLRTAWTRVDQLKGLRPENGAIEPHLLSKSRLSPSTLVQQGIRPLMGAARRRPGELAMPQRRYVLAAAAALAGAGFIAWLGTHHSGWNSYRTDTGGRERIILEDGSTVDLNTNTQLSTQISATRREIVLERGEALFHVAHDPTRPFNVRAGGTLVRAVGTEFSVRIRDADHVDVLVAEGRVAVGAPGTSNNLDDPGQLASAPRVSAGEVASVRYNIVAVRALAMKDVTRKLAWTAGRLAFQGETLDEAVQEFNRYNQRQIMIADPSILKMQVGGIFLATDPDSFIAALRQSFGVRAEVGKNTGDISLAAGERSAH
jgi:transmembrane sensor